MVEKRLCIAVLEDTVAFGDVVQKLVQSDPACDLALTLGLPMRDVEALRRAKADVIVMELGAQTAPALQAIETIMAYQPTPIIVMMTGSGAPGQAYFEAQRRGALAVVHAPTDPDQNAEVMAQLRFLATVPVVRHVAGMRRDGWDQRSRHPALPELAEPAPKHLHVLAFVGSTGAPAALAQILGEIPADFPASIVVVQHLAAGFAPHLTSWLKTVSRLPVRVAQHGDVLGAGSVLVAPDGHNLRIDSLMRCVLSQDDTPSGHLPCGDALFESVARAFGRRAVGVILSGMGEDGAAGLLTLRRAGAVTVAQDATSSVIYGMAERAVALGAVTCELSSARIAEYVCRLFNTRSIAEPAPPGEGQR